MYLKEMLSENNLENLECPITKTMELIGGKWTLPIIYVLLDDTKRFKELERSITGINTRMLVKELKKLEESGVINRVVFAEIPPRVEYSLTPKGKELRIVINEMKMWGKKHLQDKK